MAFTYKCFRGSVLIYTLFILGIALVGVLSIATVLLVQERSGLDTQDSIQSFQAASAGVERALSVYGRTSAPTLTDLAGDMGSGSFCDDSGVKATIETDVGDGDATLSFLGMDGIYLTACSDSLADAVTIRSEGSYAKATRVVETAFAVGGKVREVGAVSVSSWTGSGTQCANVAFTSTFTAPPEVFVTPYHPGSTSVHSPITWWLEDVNSLGFKACVFEIDDDGHDSISFNWIAVE